MDSLWRRRIEIPTFDPLCGSMRTDVLIIGGGMAGILCAYMLDRAGVDYALVEGGRVCGGVSGCTTAKITVGHGVTYSKLIKKYGTDIARAYLEANTKALVKYRDICKGTDCDFEEKVSAVYSLSDRGKIEKEAAALERIGCRARFTRETELPFDVAGAVEIEGQAQFHPLKFAYAATRKLRIFEKSKVTELRGTEAVTSRGTIRAERIIVATHFPFINKHGAYFLKMYQHRSYVLAMKNAQDMNRMYVDESDRGFSFRRYGDILLLGGGGHRTGKSGGSYTELEAFSKKYYPDAQEVCRWATQDCMSLDGMPYIGHYSKATPDLYVASGFNKWGMTGAMVAADILCDLVRGRENEYAHVFSPSRGMLTPQLAINAVESVSGLLTPTAPRCPHLGCALKYNRAEHSWDCPCHGSRFSEDGELLDNPATDGKKNI